MPSPPARIVAYHSLSQAEIEQLEDRLYEHNRHAISKDDGLEFTFVALDPDNNRKAIIAGYSWAGVAEIKQLWVDEGHRGFGLGSRLLEAVIAEAAARSCQAIWVLSYTFQAPAFYEKHGFERVAELPNWPIGHAHIVLRLRLNQGCQ